MEKKEKYELLVEQVKSLISGEDNAVGVMANVSSLIHSTMGFWWTGFYLFSNGELQLGPFQGSVACYRIAPGRGVCGTALAQSKTIVVPDVEQFPGHIACSSESQSEIVVPIMGSNGSVLAVLDIDSREIATFDTTDSLYLEQIASLLSPILSGYEK